MTRSKQQALMFVLGAVLVGSALGFYADRAMSTRSHSWAPRQRFFEDLALSEAQKTKMDSLLDEQACQVSAVMKPVRPRLDSIRGAARQQMTAILNADQIGKLEARRAEMARRDSLEKVRRDSVAATKKTTTTCRN